MFAAIFIGSLQSPRKVEIEVSVDEDMEMVGEESALETEDVDDEY